MHRMSDYDGRGGPSGAGTQPGEPAGKDTMAAEHEASPVTVRYGVGDELRIRRESMGKSIAEIADAVRIQKRYLEALEEGRLDHLPGTVYALGFVRTYAEYLGFSGAEMVARYKEETTGLKTQSYVMPEPIEEGKVPTAAILLVAVLLAALGYGAWYYFSQQDRQIAQQVPDVPERLASTVEEPAATSSEPVAPPVEQIATPPSPTQPAPAAVPEPAPAAPPSPMQSAPAAMPEPAPAAVPAVPSEGDAPPPVTPAVPSEGDAPSPVTEEPEGAAVEAPAPAAPPEPQPVEPAAAAGADPVGTPAAEPAAGATADAATATQPPPAPAPAAPETVTAEAPATPPVEVEPHEPVTYGLGNAGVRIIITATEDAWLEVTDADEARLFSRVLRKGDSYRAPSRPGAKFVTGNAGGLQITVDGETVPSLGPSGQVRRNVKLDPDLLKEGKAWP